jgi:hypothetical protein
VTTTGNNHALKNIYMMDLLSKEAAIGVEQLLLTFIRPPVLSNPRHKFGNARKCLAYLSRAREQQIMCVICASMSHVVSRAKAINCRARLSVHQRALCMCAKQDVIYDPMSACASDDMGRVACIRVWVRENELIFQTPFQNQIFTVFKATVITEFSIGITAHDVFELCVCQTAPKTRETISLNLI